jgi:glyoxylase-like metal-dependent hydrolase (beta-lactamase superfamily II)
MLDLEEGMKKSGVFFVCLAVVFNALPLLATDEIPTTFDRLSDRVLVVKTGKATFDKVVVIASEKGLVVVDTGLAPTLTKKYRKIIEREFGRNDFRYVINTHYHYDHSNGNQVFAEADIIGHELSPAGMKAYWEGREERMAFEQGRVNQWKRQLESLEPSSEQAQQLRDIIYTYQIMVDDLGGDFKMTPYTITFKDRMILDLGDLTLELIYFGPDRHTGDDILVHCPEEKLLCTGDLFFDGSMQLVYRPRFDAPKWLGALDYVLKDRSEVEHVVNTHGDGMNGEYLSLWRDYLADLWEGLSRAKDKGLDFTAVQDKLSYDGQFEYLERSGLDQQQLRREHQTNLRYMWYGIQGLRSAADALRQTIIDSGIESALEKFRAVNTTKSDKYYFDEVELNRLGYRFIQENRIDEAIAVFKLNVELYPESWNVYDSLGEGYMIKGDRPNAIKYYEKSLEINPNNTNGIEMLKRLKQN